MAGENAAIWQVQLSAADGTEATATSTHTLLFNTSTRIPSDGAFINSIIVDFRRAVPENESVDADNNELQDMGISGLDIVLEGVIGNVDNDTATNAINKLSKWVQDGNTNKTGSPLYTKGRYGLRLNNAPQWNVVPTTAYGFHIRDIRITYPGEGKDLAHFVIRLSLGGDIKNAI